MVKAEFYFVYLISGGFILILRPQYLIWFVPIVAQKMLNDSFIRWGISTYYSIEVVTLLPLSVFLTISSIKKRKFQNRIAIIILLLTVSMTVYKLEPKNAAIPWTMNPAKEKFYAKEFYQTAFDLKKTNNLLKQIPPTAKISVSDHLFPHLAQRKSIYLFPEVKDADYIMFSLYDNNFNYSLRDNEQRRNEFLFSNDWVIVAKEFPVFLLKNKEMSTSSSLNNRNLNFITDTIYCNFESTDIQNKLAYFNDGTEATHTSKISSGIAKSGRASLLLDAQNNYGSFIKLKDIKNLEYIKATVWYNSSANNANIVATCGSRFYTISWKAETDSADEWKKLEIEFWVPQHLDLNDLQLYLWNSEDEPAYFDDFQIVKYYIN